MKWPQTHTCHAVAPCFHLDTTRGWDEPQASDECGQPRTWRSCSYRGSMHPEDLLQVLNAGATLHGADWKYGWPHKFYVHDIRNPVAGSPCLSGRKLWTDQHGEPHEEPIPGTAPATVRAKFYNEHLLDDGYDGEALALLLAKLEEHGGIKFELNDGKLSYSAPYFGYQR